MMTMTDEEAAVEVVPLKSRISLQNQSSSRLQRSLSNGPESLEASPSSPLPRQLLVSLSFVFAAWYIPRYLIANESGIENKPVPYQQTAAKDVILDFRLNQPLVDPPTIPSNFLIWTSVWIPLLAVIITACMCNKWKHRRWHDVHHGICGLASAIGLSEGTTQLLKLYIQRRRPNFYALCGFDQQLLRCTASIDHIREANFSFPSGHSSLACCGMTFLVWFFLGKVLLLNFNNRSMTRLFGLLACVIPWGWALFVAASRIVDQWHHPSDVLAGLLLGGLTSTIAYHAWYPPAWSTYAGLPWSLRGIEAKLPSFSD